jgi:hypothetical protein
MAFFILGFGESSYGQKKKSKKTTLTVIAKLRGIRADGKVTVKNLQNETVAEGSTGTRINVPPGAYDLHISLYRRDIVCTPKMVVEGVVFKEGAHTQKEVNFSVSELTLNIYRKGRLLKVPIQLYHSGKQESCGNARSGVKMYIAPGKYDAKITLRKKVQWFKGIIVYEGAKQTYPLRF